MTPEQIRTKSAELAAFYVAKANGKTLQVIQDGKWMDSAPGAWTGHTLSYGPNLGSDLSLWRVKPEPRRMWKMSGGCSTTYDEDAAKVWISKGIAVTEWQEVLP